MDVIINLSFNKQTDPELPGKDVVNYLIKLLLPKNDRSTKDSIFDLNVNPSIKSTLFQLVLSYDQENVEQHLSIIFENSHSYLLENYGEGEHGLINLKIMYINSIEDNFYSKSTLDKTNANFNLDIKLAIKFLKNDLLNLRRNSIEESSEIDKFKRIAKIKFSMCLLAKLITDFDENNATHVGFQALCKRFVERNDEFCLWIRFYLIKNIFRRYGKSDSIQLTARNNFLNWIIPKRYLSTASVFFYSIYFLNDLKILS